MAEPVLNLNVSVLPFDPEGCDEAVSLIVHSLALEAHEFALARGIPSQSVDSQLGLVERVLERYSGDLLYFVRVPAVGATCIGAARSGFSQECYRLMTQAAKDAVLRSAIGDDDVF